MSNKGEKVPPTRIPAWRILDLPGQPVRPAGPAEPSSPRPAAARENRPPARGAAAKRVDRQYYLWIVCFCSPSP